MPPDAATAPLLLARERLEALDVRTVHELERAARDVRDLLQRQPTERTDSPAVAEDLATVRAERDAAAAAWLGAPIDDLERSAPDRLAFTALDMHASMIDGWIRVLPATVPLSGPEAIELAASWGSRTGWRALARWRRRPRPVPLRALAADVDMRLGRARAHLDGEVAAALADALRQLSRAWGATRLALDADVDPALSGSDVAEAAARVRAEHDRVQARIDRALARRRVWLSARFLPELGAAIVRGVVRTRPPTPRPASRRAIGVEHWRRRYGSVRTELDLEQALAAAESGLLGALEEELARARSEDAAVHAELDRLSALLNRSPRELAGLEPAATVTPSSARLAALARAIEAQASALPAKVTLAPRLQARGARAGRGRVVFPSRVFLEACRATVLPASAELFGAIEAEQRESAEDLARARDVVAFAVRAADRGEAGAAVVDEAVANAVTLLEFRRDVPRGDHAAGMPAGAAILRACRLARAALSGGAAVRLAQRGRQQVERGLPVALAALVRSMGRASREAVRVGRGGARRSLARIGWIRDASAGSVDVTVRPVLPAEFASDAARDTLPPLYRHMFRPEPVEDVRFLVGRQAELAAVADARARWEAGRSAGIIITGERGSGKTSLINCALLGPLDGLAIARGEFSERVLDASSLRATLAGIVGAEDPDSLEAFLAASRRVVVIEELERAFLRHIGRYEAVRALGRIINATAHRVLWVVVVNEVAFRFLDAAVDLGHRFSHRIHAGTATPAQIRAAILERHNLTGLRLRFEPPASRRGMGTRLRALVDGRPAADRTFFETVARQSGGVYRTAFNIWLGHIAGIRDGLCTIRAPVVQDLAPLIDDLSLSDLFTLVALLQHGSLTPAEHAVVFQQPVEVSRARIDDLAAREIVAPDPGRPGYRVRPEAMSVVQEALFRRNLL